MKHLLGFLLVVGMGILAGCDSNSISDSYPDAQSQVGATKTLDVPAGYLTIQDAVNASGHGDFIRVAAGTYTENVQVNSKDISLRGAGKNQTIIVGSVALYDSSEISFEGFSVQGGVHVKNSPVRITGNRMYQSANAGLWIEHSFNSIISDNELANNQQEGILLDDCTGVLGSNTVSNNATDGIVINNSSPTLESNIVELNGRDGISIRGFTGTAAPLLMNNLSIDNGAESNYGLICFGASAHPTGRGNTFDRCMNCGECPTLDDNMTYQE